MFSVFFVAAVLAVAAYVGRGAEVELVELRVASAQVWE
jgi:hypothetical protein